MGLDYAIDLYFPIDKIKDALLETVRMSVPYVYEEGHVTLTLLDGETLELPYTSHLKAAHIQLKKNTGNSWFDTVLLFPTDAILQTYNQYRNELFPSAAYKDEYEEIGYIYLSLHLGEQYVRFRFQAASSDMSRLFLRSKSIHKRMNELLRAASGVIGLIMIESSEWPLLEDSSQKIDITELDFSTEDEYYRDGYSDIDHFLEAILRAPRSDFHEKLP